MKILRWQLPRFLAVLAGFLMFGGSAQAASTGIIKGMVLDDGGVEIPGAVVTLTSPALIGGAQQQKADDEGRFIFSDLPPGGYDLSAAKEGFSTVTKRGIPVGIGRTVEVTMELKYGGADVLVVSERPVVDTESANTGQTFNQDFLSRIPAGRSYQEVVGSTPGVVDNGSGNPNSMGASYNENSIILDGVNITDPVTGTFSLNFNFDALDEVQVTTTGFDPEYNALGAIIQLSTESGGNTLKVSTAGYYSNGNWSPQYDAVYAADGTQLSPTGFDRQFQAAEVALEVSGPIVKDRVWFYGSYNYNRSLFTGAGVRNPRDFDGHYFYSKITAQPTSAHRVSVVFGANPTTIDNINQSRYVLPDAEERQAQGGFFTNVKWNFFPSNRITTEAIASIQKSYIDVSGVPCTHDEKLGYNPCGERQPENFVDFETPGRAGVGGAYSARNSGTYYIDDRWNATFKVKANFLQLDLLGKHDIKVGAENNSTWWTNVQGYAGNALYIDTYLVPYDPDSLASGYWYETTGPYVYSATGAHWVAFAADSYKPIENLTIFGGLRLDSTDIRNDVGASILKETVFGPRVSISWDPFADQKTKFFGGYGRFTDIGRLGITRYLGESGLGYKILLGEPYGGGNTSNFSNVYTRFDGRDAYDLGGNLLAPREDAFVLGAQREVVPDTAVGVNFTAKFTRGVYAFDETNLIYDEDGYQYIGQKNGQLEALYRLRTPLVSRRDYYQTDVQLIRNFAERWLAQLTYSYVVSKGTVQDSLGYGLSNPSQIDVMYGNLDTDVRHQVKLAAAWDIPNDPWTTRIGVQGQFFSGSPLSRYYYAPGGAVYDLSGDGYGMLREPLGTYGRNEAIYDIGVQLTQDIPVKKGKLQAYGQVENITNATLPYGVFDAYISYENRYVVYGRQYPINGTLGLKYEF